MWRTDSSRTDTRPLKTTSVTDPWVNEAVSTIILDTYSGVIITTTTTGNAQTLQTPTNTTEIKRFSVINNDTSTDDITVNWETISPWEVKYFLWDWSAWTTESWWWGGSGDVVWPASSTDSALVRFDWTTGKLLQDWTITQDDTGNLASVWTINWNTLFTWPDTFVWRDTTDTLTNKTLTSPVINVTSDATWDIYYRNAWWAFTRLPIWTNTQVLTVASWLPSWADAWWWGWLSWGDTISDTSWDWINISCNWNATSFVDLLDLRTNNTNTSFDVDGVQIFNDNNTWTWYNTGIPITNQSVADLTSVNNNRFRWAAVFVRHTWTLWWAVLFWANIWNTWTWTIWYDAYAQTWWFDWNWLFRWIVWPTQNWAWIWMELDLWSSAFWHTWILIKPTWASTSQTGIKIDMSTTWTGRTIEFAWTNATTTTAPTWTTTRYINIRIDWVDYTIEAKSDA